MKPTLRPRWVSSWCKMPKTLTWSSSQGPEWSLRLSSPRSQTWIDWGPSFSKSQGLGTAWSQEETTWGCLDGLSEKTSRKGAYLFHRSMNTLDWVRHLLSSVFFQTNWKKLWCWALWEWKGGHRTRIKPAIFELFQLHTRLDVGTMGQSLFKGSQKWWLECFQDVNHRCCLDYFSDIVMVSICFLRDLSRCLFGNHCQPRIH